MRNGTGRAKGSAVAATLAALAAIGLLSAGPGASAVPRQDAGGILEASPESGRPGEPLTVSGTGCAGGVVTVRIDGRQVGPFSVGDEQGEWSIVLNFPGDVGEHEVDGDCSDFTTAGAPTTFFAPGDLRFTYAAVSIETEAPELVDPTVTTPPTVPPTAPPAAAPAAPTPAAPAYTG